MKAVRGAYSIIGSRALSSGDWKGERGQLGTYTTTPYKAFGSSPFWWGDDGTIKFPRRPEREGPRKALEPVRTSQNQSEPVGVGESYSPWHEARNLTE